MTLQAWCKSDVGLKRDSNEDSCFIDEKLGLFIVADGMGGHRGGEVASRMAVESLCEVISKGKRDAGNRKLNPRLLLLKGYEEASRRIFEMSQSSSAELHGMGTTLVSVLMDAESDTAFIGNVGDSRAYLFKRDQLWQLTEDHSLVNEQIRAGLLSEHDAEHLAPKNVITRSVGFELEVQTDVIERRMEAGDTLLLCSDGLSGLVSDEKIASLCRQHKPAELVSICIEEAKRAGGDDNVTVVIVYAGQS